MAHILSLTWVVYFLVGFAFVASLSYFLNK